MSSSLSTAGRIAVFAVGLLVIFAGAVGIGSLVEPADTTSEATHGEAGHAVSEGGYSLHLHPTFLASSRERKLRFSVLDAEGEVVVEYDELHERRMHLILARRDGSGFRHLHPEMDEAGTWTVPVELGEAGVYRAFADFSVAGQQRTLASDLFVSGGDFEARPFPPPAPLALTSGYEVHLHADEPRAGESSSLTFAVSKGGEEVDDLAPYLGAKGHLVALREGDLAFLHVHPEAGGSAKEIAFAASFPTPGRYRLYLQFRHEGAVQTAPFTVSVPR